MSISRILRFMSKSANTFTFTAKLSTASKGLPVGTGGQGMLLLSGGIDSPVAGYMMASRGMELHAVYFHAFPFTSDQAKEKVIELARLLTAYTGRIKLHIVDFTDIQLTLRDHCPADMLTIVMRRMMMRIAASAGCKARLQSPDHRRKPRPGGQPDPGGALHDRSGRQPCRFSGR